MFLIDPQSVVRVIYSNALIDSDLSGTVVYIAVVETDADMTGNKRAKALAKERAVPLQPAAQVTLIPAETRVSRAIQP